MRVTKSIRIAIAVSALSATAHGQSVEQLAGLGGANARAHGINSQGQIVGQAESVTGTERAVIWENGVIRDLGSVFGDGTASRANAINDAGQVVGWSLDTSFNTSATLWNSRGMTDLGADMRATGSSTAWAINDSGQVAGQAPFGTTFSTGFFWDPTQGGGAAGTPSASQGGANLGLNDNGVMVGHSFFFGDPNHAAMSTPGKDPGTYDARTIGPDGRSLSVARAVNNSGMIVGHTNNGTGPWQAAVFTPDERDSFYSLGTLEAAGLDTSEALAVNDNGLVVGYAWDAQAQGLDPRAWAWDGREMFDLNGLLGSGSAFEVLLQATGVNNDGDIVGFGRLYNGDVRSFVISGYVPTPGAALTLIGGLAFAGRRRRS